MDLQSGRRCEANLKLLQDSGISFLFVAAAEQVHKLVPETGSFVKGSLLTLTQVQVRLVVRLHRVLREPGAVVLVLRSAPADLHDS